MIEDRYSMRATVPRELYEDKPVLEFFLKDQWLNGIRESGGTPIDDAPEIRATQKIRDGQALLPFTDDAGWDFIHVYASGQAYRPECSDDH